MAAQLIRLHARFPHRRGLLANARASGAQLILFVPTTQSLAVGSSVKVTVTIDEGTLTFELEGKVQSHIISSSAYGLNVLFDGDSKRAAAQMLATCAGRAIDDGTALDSRHSVDVSCVVTVRGNHHKATMRDISKTGAFINLPVLPAVRRDTELMIQVEPVIGRWGGSQLKAKVIWVGEKRGLRGFGVRFVDANTHVREALKKHFPSLQK